MIQDNNVTEKLAITYSGPRDYMLTIMYVRCAAGAQLGLKLQTFGCEPTDGQTEKDISL